MPTMEQFIENARADGPYFITLSVTDWVDVFIRPRYKHIIVDSLEHCRRNKGLDIYAWVLMSNHIHAIVGTHGGEHSVADIIRDFKKFTGRRLMEEIDKNTQESRRKWLLDRFRFAGANDKNIKDYRFWQRGYYPEKIYTQQFFKQKLEYIHNNPVKQEIVAKPEEYIYSSAVNYAGDKGLIDVIITR